MKKETTKTALLDIGAQLISEQGFNHTGIESVLKTAGVPKGSFYYYFESKEDFGLQLIERNSADYLTRLDDILADSTRTPLQRLRRYFEDGLDTMARQSCRKGCLIGNLSQELADQNEAFRLKLAEIFTRWNHRLADCLREAQAAGELSKEFDPVELAAFCLASYEGAMLKAKVMRSPAPVEYFIRFVFNHVLKP